MRYKIILFFFVILFTCSDKEDFSAYFIEPEIITGLNVESSYLIDQLINLSVIGDNGEDYSQISTFFIDGQEITGSQIFHSDLGVHEVFAEYSIDNQLYNTVLKSYSIVDPVNKVLLEDFTGTWCGYCPPVKYAINMAMDLYSENLTVVATHQNDEFAIDEEQDLTGSLGPFGLPEARINRLIEWIDPYDITELNDIVLTQNPIAISIESNVEGNDLISRIRFVSKESLNNHKIVVYLTENNLFADQANYLNFDENSYFYGMGNPILDYSHEDVLRYSFTNILGDEILNTEPLSENIINFNLDMSQFDFNLNNTNIIAIIVNSDNLALNSQSARVGEFQDFN